MSDRGLSVRSVVAGYGNVQAIHGISIDVRENEITALLGSNGAGKSTLLQAIAGLLRLRSGQVILEGSDISEWLCHRRVASGLVLVPEGRMIFPALTVEDNLRLGAFNPRARKDQKDAAKWVFTHFPRLLERRRQLAGTLSGGEQKMLAIGVGLMARPRFLLLDEPTLGLAPLMARTIFDSIRQLRSDGLTILLAEQDVRRTLKIADRGYVIENGTNVTSGTGAALLSDPSISSSYLGL